MDKKAFTLVELSIVLLIIGLIIGGITAGSSLIKQAKLRAITSEMNSYQTSVNTFKIAYSMLPGDMNNAASFWPGQNNGNANGQIEQNWGNANTESIYFWGHLTSSGIVPGSYTGIGTVSRTGYGSGDFESFGVNVPASKYSSNSGWGVVNINFALSMWYGTDYKNYLLFGTWGNNMMSGAMLVPQDAYTIDIKIDDGLPNTGKMVAAGVDFTSTTCMSSGVATATYVLTDPLVRCFLGFAIVGG
jgi:prepilin-type N-terminal cleavage/methylation domain-containing protein